MVQRLEGLPSARSVDDHHVVVEWMSADTQVSLSGLLLLEIADHPGFAACGSHKTFQLGGTSFSFHPYYIISDSVLSSIKYKAIHQAFLRVIIS